MSFIFQEKPVAVIKAKETGTSGNAITINGVTKNVTTPDAAAEQINKIFGIVGKPVGASGMTHTTIKEAVSNG